ncbi:MAG: DUF3501 family protein [Acidimicrobiales bacterium]
MNLTLADIADVRAYEREREELRARIIEMKKVRRVAVGPVLTFVFENRDTVRFQIQEMARAEKLSTDGAIQAELDTYNPLIPAPGQLSATLFVELTNREEMERWLPALVGVERAAFIEVAEGVRVGSTVDEEHASLLTREAVTASVHYVRFELAPSEVAAFATGTVILGVDHPSYSYRTSLGPETRGALLEDLQGG